MAQKFNLRGCPKPILRQLLFYLQAEVMTFEKNPHKVEQYKDHYTEEGLKQKLSKVARRAGLKVVYLVLVLYYALRSDKISVSDKAMIYGALGYFILPLDLLPDLIPLLGYSDDLSALIIALSRVAKSIDDEIRSKAKQKLEQWFTDYDPKKIDEIEPSK